MGLRVRVRGWGEWGEWGSESAAGSACSSSSPVISPFWMVNGMTRSKGLSPATSRPFIPIGRSVAWGTEVRGQGIPYLNPDILCSASCLHFLVFVQVFTRLKMFQLLWCYLPLTAPQKGSVTLKTRAAVTDDVMERELHHTGAANGMKQ